MLTGEQIWAGFGGMQMPPSPFGPQMVPEGEDVRFSRQDTGAGWDQAFSMEREPPDGSSLPLSAMALPLPEYLHLERNQGSNAEQVAPLLRGENLRDRHGSYVDLIEWAPEPGVQHAGGLTGPVRSDVLPDIAKMLPDFDYAVIDTEQLLDEAIRRTRRAMYGR